MTEKRFLTFSSLFVGFLPKPEVSHAGTRGDQDLQILPVNTIIHPAIAQPTPLLGSLAFVHKLLSANWAPLPFSKHPLTFHEAHFLGSRPDNTGKYLLLISVFSQADAGLSVVRLPPTPKIPVPSHHLRLPVNCKQRMKATRRQGQTKGCR